MIDIKYKKTSEPYRLRGDAFSFYRHGIPVRSMLMVILSCEAYYCHYGVDKHVYLCCYYVNQAAIEGASISRSTIVSSIGIKTGEIMEEMRFTMDRVRVGGILADDLRVIKLVDDVLGVLNEVLSLVREGDALVSARDEETPQFIFQIADRLGEILCKEIGCKIAAEFRTFGKRH